MAALSEWGLVPRMDVLPLEQVESAFPVKEPQGLPPKYIHKVSLTDVIGESGFLLKANAQVVADRYHR